MTIKNETPRNYAIDMLRGLSILYIVAYWHLFNYTKAFPQYNNFATLRLTYIFLGLFTFLSGYLIGYKEQINNFPDILVFHKKKAIRLFPLYIAAIILFYLLTLSNSGTLVKAAVLASMLYAPAPLTLWFIVMIFNFYLVSPFLVPTSKNKLKYFLFCTSLMLTFSAYDYYTGLLDRRIIMYFPSFALGLFIGSRRKTLSSFKPSAIAFLFAISLAVSSVNFETKILSALAETPLITVGAFLIFYVFNYHKRVSPYSKKIEILSYSSLCMYLFHRPVYAVLTNIYFPRNEFSQLGYLVFVCVPLIILISYFTQKGYDIFVRYYGSRKIKHKNIREHGI